ncbi:MAG: hypothetical protein Q8K75_11405 [Chlamydiales bacterium]|nr:hypothetical protein [Chlamydiales bacterium]
MEILSFSRCINLLNLKLGAFKESNEAQQMSAFSDLLMNRTIRIAPGEMTFENVAITKMYQIISSSGRCLSMPWRHLVIIYHLLKYQRMPTILDLKLPFPGIIDDSSAKKVQLWLKQRPDMYAQGCYEFAMPGGMIKFTTQELIDSAHSVAAVALMINLSSSTSRINSVQSWKLETNQMPIIRFSQMPIIQFLKDIPREFPTDLPTLNKIKFDAKKVYALPIVKCEAKEQMCTRMLTIFEQYPTFDARVAQELLFCLNLGLLKMDTAESAFSDLVQRDHFTTGKTNNKLIILAIIKFAQWTLASGTATEDQKAVAKFYLSIGEQLTLPKRVRCFETIASDIADYRKKNSSDRATISLRLLQSIMYRMTDFADLEHSYSLQCADSTTVNLSYLAAILHSRHLYHYFENASQWKEGESKIVNVQHLPQRVVEHLVLFINSGCLNLMDGLELSQFLTQLSQWEMYHLLQVVDWLMVRPDNKYNFETISALFSSLETAQTWLPRKYQATLKEAIDQARTRGVFYLRSGSKETISKWSEEPDLCSFLLSILPKVYMTNFEQAVTAIEDFPIPSGQVNIYFGSDTKMTPQGWSVLERLVSHNDVNITLESSGCWLQIDKKETSGSNPPPGFALVKNMLPLLWGDNGINALSIQISGSSMSLKVSTEQELRKIVELFSEIPESNDYQTTLTYENMKLSANQPFRFRQVPGAISLARKRTHNDTSAIGLLNRIDTLVIKKDHSRLDAFVPFISFMTQLWEDLGSEGPRSVSVSCPGIVAKIRQGQKCLDWLFPPASSRVRHYRCDLPSVSFTVQEDASASARTFRNENLRSMSVTCQSGFPLHSERVERYFPNVVQWDIGLPVGTALAWRVTVVSHALLELPNVRLLRIKNCRSINLPEIIGQFPTLVYLELSGGFSGLYTRDRSQPDGWRRSNNIEEIEELYQRLIEKEIDESEQSTTSTTSTVTSESSVSSSKRQKRFDS